MLGEVAQLAVERAAARAQQAAQGAQVPARAQQDQALLQQLAARDSASGALRMPSTVCPVAVRAL